MPREHGERGEFVETVTLEDVLGVFDAVEGPVVLSADVADALGCSRETARRKLEALYERGDLARRKVARRVIYWCPEDAPREERDAGAAPGREDSAEGDDTPESTPEPNDARAGDSRPLSESGLDDVLAGWEPETQADAETARTQTRRTAEYLQAEGGRHTRSDLVDALAAESSLGERSWWERAVQPGLRRLRDAGLVEYRAGYHDYRWVDDGEE